MMKNLLLTLFTVLLASASFSQLDLEAKLVDPITDTTRDTQIRYTLKVINRGTVAINTGDSLYTTLYINGTRAIGLYYDDVSVPAGDSLTLTPVTLQFQGQPSAQLYQAICITVSTEVSKGTDVNLANNQDCYMLDRSLAGVGEKSINEEVSITAVYGVLKMTSANEENYSYSIYSMAGQVISQGSFVNSTEVDMTGVAKGIYAVVVSNGTEKITKKISIQ